MEWRVYNIHFAKCCYRKYLTTFFKFAPSSIEATPWNCPLRCPIRSSSCIYWHRPGLHNSESSRGQIDQHKFSAGRKSRFRCSLEEIMKRQLIIQVVSHTNSESKSIALYFAGKLISRFYAPNAKLVYLWNKLWSTYFRHFCGFVFVWASCYYPILGCTRSLGRC